MTIILIGWYWTNNKAVRNCQNIFWIFNIDEFVLDPSPDQFVLACITDTTLYTALKMANYADIDFEEINDVTGLANDEIKCLKVGRKMG